MSKGCVSWQGKHTKCWLCGLELLRNDPVYTNYSRRGPAHEWCAYTTYAGKPIYDRTLITKEYNYEIYTAEQAEVASAPTNRNRDTDGDWERLGAELRFDADENGEKGERTDG